MGIYLNPRNDSFREAINSQIYVDKTGLISVTNERLRTKQKYICVSRPRRFGKSLNLGMLAAYYSRGCESRELFEGLAIAGNESFDKHLNQYNVIYINIQEFLSGSGGIRETLALLKRFLLKDFRRSFPELEFDADVGLWFSFSEVYHETGIPFVILIDEWDCVMREHRDNREALNIYLDFI